MAAARASALVRMKGMNSRLSAPSMTKAGRHPPRAFGRHRAAITEGGSVIGECGSDSLEDGPHRCCSHPLDAVRGGTDERHERHHRVAAASGRKALGEG